MWEKTRIADFVGQINLLDIPYDSLYHINRKKNAIFVHLAADLAGFVLYKFIIRGCKAHLHSLDHQMWYFDSFLV